MPDHPLFVFGTLRRGEVNHRFLSGRYVRMFPAVLHGFRRTVAAHGYPAIVRADGDSVRGELYFIRPNLYAETMQSIDRLEDIPAGATVGEYYRRAVVTVETSEGSFTAWAYIDANTAP
jgi:gamma-glutamylcyclotransferase (GGCT)/AIG2-like uncharacterized protein YtfP